MGLLFYPDWLFLYDDNIYKESGCKNLLQGCGMTMRKPDGISSAGFSM